ncbi:MAG: isocitrate lyase [Gemmatimonadales bacterium]
MNQRIFVNQHEHSWKNNPRWEGITRPYAAAEVWRLAGTVHLDHTLARLGAERLWELLDQEPFLPVLSALTGCQAVQEVKAGLKAIYVSGWQVAGDMNDAGEIYPDLSLYPVDSVPNLVARINKALLRADQIHHVRGDHEVDWMVPLVADAEAGFGGVLNAFELMKQMIDKGAAAVHFEDQLASAKKCGHLGGKVLVPTSEFVQKLVAARLAADVCGVSTVIIARTDALSAGLLSSDSDPYDREFTTGERTPDGFCMVRTGIESAVARALAYAPYADMLWFETSRPDIVEAERFAEAIHDKYPDKLLAYNCSPSFNWKLHLGDQAIADFQKDLGALGYRFQFVTLSGFHALNHATYALAKDYHRHGMSAYAELQEREFALEEEGYEAIRHQEFVGAGYYDTIARAVSAGETSTLALEGSTEQDQFTPGRASRMVKRVS